MHGWGGPWIDLAFGFYKIAPFCYGPWFHEPGTVLSLLTNKEAFEDFPPNLQNIIRTAADSEVMTMLSEFTAKNAIPLRTLVEDHDATLAPLSLDILTHWFEVSDEVLTEIAEEGDIPCRVYENWSEFCKRSIDIADIDKLGFLRGRAGESDGR